MAAIEIIAGLFVIASLTKVMVLLVRKEEWATVVEKVYGNRNSFRAVFGLLALVILFFLLKEFTIVDIMAVMAFVAMFMAYGLMEFAEEAEKISTDVLKKELSSSMFFFITIWLLLLIWAFAQLFLM